MKSELDKYQKFMMDLLKLECNVKALDSIMYGRFERYNEAISDAQKRRDEFIVDNKVTFNLMREGVEG